MYTYDIFYLVYVSFNISPNNNGIFRLEICILYNLKP